MRLSTASKDKAVMNNYVLNKAYISVFNGELEGKVKCYILDKLDMILKYLIALYLLLWPSKSDSAPVRGDGYEPRSSKFRLRANAETSHSVRYDMVVVVASIVGGEKFSHGMVRSRKPPPLVPLIIITTTLSS